jgi:hypothetical protein
METRQAMPNATIKAVVD